jgi:hypothetical protein
MSKAELDKRVVADTSMTNSFLRRWSEHKTQAREPEEQRGAEVLEPLSELPARELSDADMPPLESLNEHSDYRGFFSPKVSETLRRQALRKLFHSPGFNVTDGLDIYQEDYTRFADLGEIITQDMRHRLEMEAKRMAQAVVEVPPNSEGQDNFKNTAESFEQLADADSLQAIPGETQPT